MKDSMILQQLICMAYECETEVDITLADCLGLYGRMLMAEADQKAEPDAPAKEEKPQAPAKTPKAPDPKPEKTPSGPNELQVTGKGSVEKKAIHAKLKAYREKHGLGSYTPLAKASNRALTEDTIRAMATGEGTFPLSKWKVLEAAIDYCEQQEQKEETTP